MVYLPDVIFPAELGKKAVEVNSRAPDGDTPLHVMAWRNDLEGAQLLIDGGANVNAAGDMGSTPLHVAIYENNIEMAKLLLKAGADSAIRSEFGRTPREDDTKKGGAIAKLF